MKKEITQKNKGQDLKEVKSEIREVIRKMNNKPNYTKLQNYYNQLSKLMKLYSKLSVTEASKTKVTTIG